jgi:serine/threonine-protein kinase
VHTTEQLNAALDGRYLVERLIGQGGMATVYLAKDLRHNRPVALKVLRPDLGAVVGVERFLSEIQVTANLQHPNLLPLFDSGAAGDLLYYVMPFVEGESLRARLQREKQLPVDEAIHLATAVGSALDYAHRHGVIHRDLKPENILLHEGQPLVADFGIALAVSNAGGNRITQTGLSLGTPQYMSPEQATGDRAIDGRTDIYSLGAVLYEMLTGEPPHTGSTSQAIIARVLTETPRSLRATRSSVPPFVEAAVTHALEKLPADRWATCKEFAEALAGTRAVPTDAETGARARAVGRRWYQRPATMVAGVAAFSFALGLLATSQRGGYAWTPRVYDVGLPDSAPISFTGGSPWGEGWRAVDIAPDGSFAIYVARRHDSTELWFRSLVDTTARPLPGTDGAYFPMLSPDASQVAYFVGKRLVVSPVAGGTAVTIGEVDRPRGGEWSESNGILIADNNGFQLRSFDPVVRSNRLLASRTRLCPMPSQATRNIVLCSWRQFDAQAIGSNPDRSMTLRLESSGLDSAAPPLVGTHGRLVGGSILVFLGFDGTLFAARVELAAGRAGRPTPVLGGVRREGFDAAGQFAIASNGTLVYVPGDNAERGRFATIRANAAPQELRIPEGTHLRFDVTRDGKRVVVVQVAADGTQELWVYDAESGGGERWLRGFYIGEPRWDPTGRRVAFQLLSTQSAPLVTVMGTPGTSTPLDTLLVGSQSVNVFEFRADSLLLGTALADGQQVPLRIDARTRPAERTAITKAAVFAQALSPDGRWLAYAAGTVGGWDNFVEPFPSGGRSMRLSPEGGLEPLWQSDRQIVYRAGASWFTVDFEPGRERPVGSPRKIASDPRFLDTQGRSNVLMPDGAILYVRGSPQTTGAFLRVIPRFTDEVRQRVP